MTDRAASRRSGLRRPTLGQWVGLVVALGLVWLAAVVVDGYADWPLLPWVIAAGMLVVLVAWLSRLRVPDDSPGEGSRDRGSPSTSTRDGASGSGSARP